MGEKKYGPTYQCGQQRGHSGLLLEQVPGLGH